MNRKAEVERWNDVARKFGRRHRYDSLLAEHYWRSHWGLIQRWITFSHGNRILKTDLFAEAVHPTRAFWWALLETGSDVVGMDLSLETVSSARSMTDKSVPVHTPTFVNADVRALPFAGSSFDIVISDSTLDHFGVENDIGLALSELGRVLKPGGTLVITLDNKSNLTEPFYRFWVWLGLNAFPVGKTYSITELKKALKVAGFGVVDSDAIIHNPRLFTRVLFALVHKISSKRLDGLLKRVLMNLDSLGKRRSKYLTALFVAVKAVKLP